MEEFLATVKIKRLPLETIYKLAVQDKQDWYDSTGQWERWAFDADIETQTRWAVNFIRHNLVEYDYDLACMKNKTGISSIYYEFQHEILKQIMRVYPELKDECERQMK